MMKKNLLLSAVLFFACYQLFSQNSFELGISSGITNYYGDLGNQAYYQTGSTRPGVAITLRNFIKPKATSGQMYRALNAEARFAWYRLGYDETKPVGNTNGFELRNYGRGLSFRNDIFAAEGHVTYTLYPNIRQPLHVQKAAMYFYTGIGIFYGKPKADLFRGDIDISNRYYFWHDGTVRDAPEQSGQGNVIQKDGKYETDLTEWKTEGNAHKSELGRSTPACYYDLGIPIGMGIRYGISKKITMSVEFSYYHLFCDKVDDVSDRYATEAQIESNFPNDKTNQELATYISDPTGWGSDGTDGPATSPRGNPKKTDSFSYISLEFAYRFEFIPKKLFGMR